MMSTFAISRGWKVENNTLYARIWPGMAFVGASDDPEDGRPVFFGATRADVWCQIRTWIGEQE